MFILCCHRGMAIGHCQSSLGSFNECRFGTKQLPETQQTDLGCEFTCRLGKHLLLLLFIIITQPEG